MPVESHLALQAPPAIRVAYAVSCTSGVTIRRSGCETSSIGCGADCWAFFVIAARRARKRESGSSTAWASLENDPQSSIGAELASFRTCECSRKSMSTGEEYMSVLAVRLRTTYVQMADKQDLADFDLRQPTLRRGVPL